MIVSTLVLLMAACSRKEETPASPSTASAAPAEPLAAGTPAELAPPEATSGVAVDEPLPPFEEDSGIVLVSRSTFQTVDASVSVGGDVFLYEAPDGSRLLRLENLQTPKDLHIDLALATSAAPRSEAEARSATVLGPLKGPSGNMNYLLESGVNLAPVKSFALLEHGTARVLGFAPVRNP